mmetsp:Transcript_19223/g.22907  ORF Transcript_19223/g.22907 Transcript_19223/m.22907 type:complete len:134 (-) Transcript_19223:57-458(-)
MISIHRPNHFNNTYNFDFLDAVRMEALKNRPMTIGQPILIVNRKKTRRRIPHTVGHYQQSVDSFFEFVYKQRWSETKFGDSPTITNDVTFQRVAKHARYVDAVGLASNETHFYWQADVKKGRSVINPKLSGWW